MQNSSGIPEGNNLLKKDLEFGSSEYPNQVILSLGNE